MCKSPRICLAGSLMNQTRSLPRGPQTIKTTTAEGIPNDHCHRPGGGGGPAGGGWSVRCGFPRRPGDRGDDPGGAEPVAASDEGVPVRVADRGDGGRGR